MSKYYCLIAGLPHVSLDDTKLISSVADFKQEVNSVLSDFDRHLINWFYLKYDNRNLLQYVRKDAKEDFDERGVFSMEEIAALCDLLKNEDRIPVDIQTPAYIVAFIREYFACLDAEESIDWNMMEDKLSALYFEAAIGCGNEFLSSWFEMNLNIRNILCALNCRKYGLSMERYIIGNNEIAVYLRHAGTRELYFGNETVYLTELTQIIEEKDTMEREKRLDLLRWKWLDAHSFYKTFDFEAVITHIICLEMLERWLQLDKVLGEKTFRKLVFEMKKESAVTLNEFKEKNK